MFFIDHDQPEMLHRSKHRTASSHNNLHFAAGNPLPVPVPLGIGQMAVQNGDRVKPAGKSANRLRREADFRHKNNRLSPVTHDLANCLDVDFRLAAPGDTVQYERPMSFLPQLKNDRVECPFLVRIQLEIRLAFDIPDGCLKRVDSFPRRNQKSLIAQ